MGGSRRSAAAEVDDAHREEEEVHQRGADEQCRAQPRVTQEVSRAQPGEEQGPEEDLAGDDEPDQYVTQLLLLPLLSACLATGDPQGLFWYERTKYS